MLLENMKLFIMNLIVIMLLFLKIFQENFGVYLIEKINLMCLNIFIKVIFTK